MAHKTDRLYNNKWGLFIHYLGGQDAEAWNRRVDAVDVDAWADQFAELGAGFFGFPIMQVYRCMAAPNDTYDRITGYRPGEACARRDLILDLSDALRKRGIDLMLYYTGDGPCADPAGGAAFGFSRIMEDGKWTGFIPDTIKKPFVRKWASVAEEYSLRYGDRIFAWWIDGCYAGGNVDFLKRGYDDDKMAILKKAVTAGNPNAVVAFNNGIFPRVRAYTCLDDFTAGEMNELEDLPDARFINGVQWFQFSCNGFWTGVDKAGRAYTQIRYTPEYVKQYVETVHRRGGVCMFDMGLVDNRNLDPGQCKALSMLKELR